MSRPIRKILTSSIPVFLAALALTACGSGSGGSADLGEGSGGGVVVDKPVTVNETFDFAAPLSYFVVGNPPIHARFLGGVAANNGAWIVKEGTTATINFGTPADHVKFDAKDNYGGLGAEPGAHRSLGAKGSGRFDVATYVRGSIYNDWVADAATSSKDDWARASANKFKRRCVHGQRPQSVRSTSARTSSRALSRSPRHKLEGRTNCGTSATTTSCRSTRPTRWSAGGRGWYANCRRFPSRPSGSSRSTLATQNNPALTVAKDPGSPVRLRRWRWRGGADRQRRDPDLRTRRLTPGLRRGLLKTFKGNGTDQRR